MDDDEKQKAPAPVLPRLCPVSQERAREIADEYTKHMREKVEQAARQKQKGNQDAATEQHNPADED
jgi:hypothetical protein